LIICTHDQEWQAQEPVDMRLDLRFQTQTPLAARLAVATGAVVAALLVRIALDRWMKVEAPFLLFLAAIVAAAWYGGIGSGLWATFLAAAATNYFFIKPYGRFVIAPGSQALAFGLFLAESLIACVLCASLHAARRSAEDEAARARQLERTVLEISDAEQRRIGQDLHDGLGQHLTGVAFLAKALHQRLIDRGDADDASAAARLAQLTNEAISTTRDLARGLSPEAMEFGGLVAALQNLTDSSARVFGIPCTFQTNTDGSSITSAAAIHLLRIAQEAVTNAIKHAKPPKIEVELHDTEGIVQLKIIDHGVGISDEALREAPGMGLQIMKFRAEMIGSRMEVARVPNGGTVIQCRLPATFVHRQDRTAELAK
jgi:signal transduction histidine kinase